MVVWLRGICSHCNGFGQLLSFYSFRSQYLYSSTSTNTNLLAKYLVDSLGFSNEEAASASSKVTSLKSLKKPHLVINFFKQIGFENTQMKKIVSRAPKMLLCDVSKTLKPKFQCLVDLGLSGSDLVNVIAKDAQIIGRGLDTHLRPTIDFLKRILGSDENVVECIKRSSWLLSFGVHGTLETNILLFRNYGVPDVRIKRLLLRYPSYFAQNPERTKRLLHRVENDFRVPRDSPSFVYGCQVLNSQSNSTLDRKFGIFKSFGWSDNDILHVFRKLPCIVSISEGRIKKALNLFMKDLGFESAYLISHPAIMVYSLEKRVVPRMQVLKILDEKKLQRRKLMLYSVLSLTEIKFIEYFVLPYKDQIPHLYEPLKKIVLP